MSPVWLLQAATRPHGLSQQSFSSCYFSTKPRVEFITNTYPIITWIVVLCMPPELWISAAVRLGEPLTYCFRTVG